MKSSYRVLYGLLCLVVAIEHPKKVLASDIYKPSPISRPLATSVDTEIPWNQFIRFIVNRGPNRVSYLDEALNVLEPKRIQRLEGYESPSNSRFNVIGYELRSRELVDRAEQLLNLGYYGRIVVDPSTITYPEMPSDGIWNAWSEKQKLYFIRSYDRDKDDKVTEADLERVRHERQLAHDLWERLRRLQVEFPNRLELITPEFEMVPVNETFNYPRLHHLKKISVQFRKNRQSWKAPVLSMDTSANATSSCLDKRVDPDPANIEAYLGGHEFRYVPGSQGHIQFGAIFGEQKQDPEIMKVLNDPLEDWIKLYKEAKHFDSRPVSEKQIPRIIFQGGKASLQAFFTEGSVANDTIDPVWVASQYLSRTDIHIKTYYEGDYVFSHKLYASHLRSALAFHQPENFGIFIDGSQALSSFSALPELTYSPLVRDAEGVFKNRVIEDTPSLPKGLQWEKNIFIYQSGRSEDGVHARDKAHLKAKYLEYVDAFDVTHHVVIWGSANSSYNAAKLDADVVYVFESSDPEVGKQIRPFFESLREDSRMIPYSEATVEKILSDHFYYNETLRSVKFRKSFVHFLSGGKQRRSFENILIHLESAGAKTSQGALLLKLFRWNLRYKSAAHCFTWTDLALALRLTDPNIPPRSNFVEALKTRWLIEVSYASQRGAKNSFSQLQADLALRKKIGEMSGTAVPEARRLIQRNCSRFFEIFSNAGILDRKKVPLGGNFRLDF